MSDSTEESQKPKLSKFRPHGLDNPYFLLFNQIIVLTVGFILEVGKRALDISNAKVEFIFDEQGVLGRDAVGWWDVLK
jgi:hypothetical protein